MSDEPIKNHADYEAAVKRAITNIGKTNGSKLPAVNDHADRIVLEYAISKMIAKEANDRLKEAETALKALYAKPTKKGKVVVHNTAFAVVSYDLKGGQFPRSEASIIAAAQEQGLSAAKAKLVADNSKGEQVMSHMVEATLLR